MSRIPTHTIEDAPAGSRPLLHDLIQSSPTGRPLNVHAQMAHSPAVLASYVSLRAVTTELGTLDPKLRAALNLVVALAVGNDYVVELTSRLARLTGWTEEQVAALWMGTTTTDAKIDALTVLVREAATNSGKVSDATWQTAQQAGWSDEQLTEAFAYVGLTLFTSYFTNYAQTAMDV